jgi:transcriptional regulator with XRE-family HTH domain
MVAVKKKKKKMMMMMTATRSDVLRSVRRGCSLSQDDLKSGYHRTYIGQLERGEKSPSLRTIFNLASTMGVLPSELVRGVERAVGFRPSRDQKPR